MRLRYKIANTIEILVLSSVAKENYVWKVGERQYSINIILPHLLFSALVGECLHSWCLVGMAEASGKVGRLGCQELLLFLGQAFLK